ncbi:MAG: Ig-like domain repeat protein [Capsulimonadaceae bacterium]|nr:Ig-like domain repeat protein [Capsulimonadaceae bacterium]
MALFSGADPLAASPPTFTTLYSFTGSADGGTPNCGLILGSDGSFYGTTQTGGAYGAGTVFKITSTGAIKTMYSFTGGTDGQGPGAGLVQASDGNFYGSTAGGGTYASGTIFRISASGSLATLHSFAGGAGGAPPSGNLIEGSDGNFYGVTITGGDTNVNSGHGLGTVFKMSPTGSLTTLYAFTGGSDGSYPWSSLVEGNDGCFYGTTLQGGDITAINTLGYGTIFKVTADGSFSAIYSFTGGMDGASPQQGLILGSDGNFYGTAPWGGASNQGNVFRITPQGTLTVVCSFTGGLDGGVPWTGLVSAGDGSYFVSTLTGGVYGGGTVDEISSSGAVTILHSFTGDAYRTYGAAATLGGDGNLYGITWLGGSGAYGTIFRIALASSATTLQALPNPSTVGESVTLRATVSPSVADGETVTFYDGSSPIGTGTTASSLASLTISALTQGLHTITAVYTGDSMHVSSTSNKWTQTVNSAPPAPSFSAGLSFFSSPYDYPGVSLDTLLGYTGVKFAVFEPASYSYDVTPNGVADAIRLGVGYWARFPQEVTFTSIGTAASSPFAIALTAGWNMIGDPFTRSIPLSSLTFGDNGESFSVATSGSNPLVNATFWGYMQSTNKYAVATSLRPLNAYWVYAYSGTTMYVQGSQ